MTTKILIVDDEPPIILSLRFLMKQQGYETREAADGLAALEEVEQFQPDLILLDIAIPKLNGFEVCQRIRSNPDWQATKIVMLTARGRQEEIEKGLTLGADLYITKPFSTRELVAQVNELLAQ
ncbi:MAG: response regulator, partial [Anaerolineales bacterium]|nr:response regulator [Anaerolineales bacterium]